VKIWAGRGRASCRKQWFPVRVDLALTEKNEKEFRNLNCQAERKCPDRKNENALAGRRNMS
jgi:hypothetical protein